MLLTGDNQAAADQLAAHVGMTDVRAALRPHDKVAAVKELQAGGHKVSVVGDGTNDAPALAAADSGIAMGGAGSDLTLQTAGAVVVHDDLIAIPTAIALSRLARRVVVANLIIAATFITVLVTWDLAPPCRCPSASPDMKAPPSSSNLTACDCWAKPPDGEPAELPDYSQPTGTDFGEHGGGDRYRRRHPRRPAAPVTSIRLGFECARTV